MGPPGALARAAAETCLSASLHAVRKCGIDSRIRLQNPRHFASKRLEYSSISRPILAVGVEQDFLDLVRVESLLPPSESTRHCRFSRENTDSRLTEAAVDTWPRSACNIKIYTARQRALARFLAKTPQRRGFRQIAGFDDDERIAGFCGKPQPRTAGASISCCQCGKNSPEKSPQTRRPPEHGDGPEPPSAGGRDRRQ